MAKLGDLAGVVRSKNAGALLCTLDVIFDNAEAYAHVLDSQVISPDRIALLYGVSANEVQVIPYDVAFAIKITIPRLVPSGSFGDGDVYGAQQHAPLLDLDVPEQA